MTNAAGNSRTGNDIVLPMTVVTGYLGSGKTTLINRLLTDNHDRRFMVLVNDFGEISLDESLIDNRSGDVISLANGCMCCQIGGDLYRTIDQVLSMKDRLDGLVVETSGVADPSKIAMIAVAEPELSLNGTLVLVDCLNFPDLLTQPSLSDTLQRQLNRSDLALLTKCNLVSDHAVSETMLRIKELKPGLAVTDSSDEALSIVGTSREAVGRPEAEKTAQPLHAHSVPFDSFTWKGPGVFETDDLCSLLEKPELGVYRAKGIFRLGDGKWVTFNKVGKRTEIAPFYRHADLSVLTVIGSKAAFKSRDFETAWRKFLGQPGSSNAG